MTMASYGVLIILCIAIYLWITEKIPPAVTGLLIIVLLPLFKVVTFSQAISGFVNGSVWLLIGVYILSAAMNEIGLDKRIAYSLVIRGRANAKNMVYMSVAAVVNINFYTSFCNWAHSIINTDFCGSYQDNVPGKEQLSNSFNAECNLLFSYYCIVIDNRFSFNCIYKQSVRKHLKLFF
jgi:xanthine/uracil permease